MSDNLASLSGKDYHSVRDLFARDPNSIPTPPYQDPSRDPNLKKGERRILLRSSRSLVKFH